MRLRTLFVTLAVVALSLACGDATGPAGATYFRAKVDGVAWKPQISLATCSDSGLSFTMQRTDTATGASEVLEVWVAGIHALGTYALGDTATGRYGLYVVFPSVTGPGVFYRTASGNPGSVTFTSLSRTDSLFAGTVTLPVATGSGVADQKLITASFRLEYSPVYTVENPDGTQCLVPVPGA